MPGSLLISPRGIPLFGLMIAGYLGSRALDAKKDPRWLLAHLVFHVSLAVGMCQVMLQA